MRPVSNKLAAQGPGATTMNVGSKEVPDLHAPDGTPLLCQHWERKPGCCLACGSTNIGAQCPRKGRYPDLKCCEHTSFLRGSRNERCAADNCHSIEHRETALYKAWQLHYESVSGVKR